MHNEELTYEQRSRADDLYADCCREDDVLLSAAYELIGLRDRHSHMSERHWTCNRCGGQWFCDRADVPKDRGNSAPKCGCPYCEVVRLRQGLNQIAWPAAYGLPSEPTSDALRHIAQDTLAIGVPVASERSANPPAIVLAKLVLDMHKNPSPPGERMNAALSIAQNIVDDSAIAEPTT